LDVEQVCPNLHGGIFVRELGEHSPDNHSRRGVYLQQFSLRFRRRYR
jgi:hypothetical protein